MSGGKTSPIIEEKPKKKPKKPRKKVRPLVPTRRMPLAMPDSITQTNEGGLVLAWKEKSGERKMIYTEMEIRTFHDIKCMRVEADGVRERKTAQWTLRSV